MLRSVTQSVVRPFNEPSKLCVYLTKENISQTKWSCFEPDQPIFTYSPQIGCNFNHYLAKQSLDWQNFQDGCPIVHRQRLWIIFLQWAFKFEILSTTFYKYAVLFQSWNYKEWNLIFWFLSMCKLRRITHKFNIKPSGLYSICEWFAGVYTSIKTKKQNFIPIINYLTYNFNLGAKVIRNLAQYPLHQVTYMYELNFGAKVTRKLAQYPLHHVTFAAAKLELLCPTV